MTAIPGQPLICIEGAFNTRFGSGSTQYFTDLTNRVHSRYTFQRGQQYERSQAQAGTASITLRDNDGYLTEGNSGSPYYPGVDLYRQIRIRAQYPQTQNLLTGDQATGGGVTPIAPGAIPAAMNISAQLGTPVIAASGSAWQGAQVYSTPVAASATVAQSLLAVNLIPIIATSPAAPTPSYAWSIYARSVTSGATPSAAAAIVWYNIAGTIVSTTTGTTAAMAAGGASSGWTRFTVAGSPPAGAVFADVVLLLEGTAPTSAWTCQTDGLQVEQAAAASAWTQPGAWYPMWSGPITDLAGDYSGEGVPDSSGNYAVVRLQATDVLGVLGQSKLNDCFINTLWSYAPDFLYPLSDPAYPTGQTQGWADWTGNRTPGSAVSANGAYMSAAQSSAAPVPTGYSTGFYGTNGPFAQTNNVNAEFNTFPGTINAWWAAGISLGTPVGTSQAGPPAASAWTRVMAVSMQPVENTMFVPSGYNGPTLLRCMVWAAVGPTPNGYPQVSLSAYQPVTWSSGVETFGTEEILFEAFSASGTHITSAIWSGNTPARLDDGYWKLIAISLSADGKTFTVQIGDMNTATTYSYTISTGGVDFRTTSGAGYQTDVMGCWWAPWQGTNTTYPGGYGPVQYGLLGQLGPVAEYNYAITSAQFADMWTSFQSAYAGDGTGTRVQRYLGWAQYAGASEIDTGSQAMGAAGGLGSANGPWSGASALSQLQSIAFLEQGMVCAGADGTPVFHAAAHRVQQVVPAVVFGEKAAGWVLGDAVLGVLGTTTILGGELPYYRFRPGYDNVEVINLCQLSVSNSTSGSTSAPVSAVNSASINSYFPQTVQQTVNPQTIAQGQGLADSIAAGDGKPQRRITALQAMPSHTAGLWAPLLGLDLDTLVQVNRRPLGGAVINLAAFIEQISWEIDPSVPSAAVTYQGTNSGITAP